MNNLILICGQAESGKTTLAELIKKHLDTKPTGEIFDVTLIRNNGQTVKDIAISKHDWDGKKDAKGRQLLLDITKEGYDKNPYYWESATFTEAIMHKEFENRYCEYLIIPDWRYESTLDYFKDRFDNILTIRVDRPNTHGTHKNHPSENHFKGFNVDLVVENNGDKIKLDKIAKRIANNK